MKEHEINLIIRSLRKQILMCEQNEHFIPWEASFAYKLSV